MQETQRQEREITGGHSAAPPWEPQRLDKKSGIYVVPWSWWEPGCDGRDQ
jgi:hypothetical protein